MPPSPYLFHVNSTPMQVSDPVWKQWYITEHFPDLVNSSAATRATFYEEIDLPGDRKLNNPRKFLALFQTNYPELLEAESCKDLRTTSELFKKDGADSDNMRENGDFDARNYELIQEYDPNRIGEVAPSQILTAEMHPQDPADFDKWYREEHLEMVSELPGYRRTLRYKIGPRTPLTKDAEPPGYLSIHEVDDVENALNSTEAAAANATPWTQKHMKESKPFIARGWKLLHAEGY